MSEDQSSAAAPPAPKRRVTLWVIVAVVAVVIAVIIAFLVIPRGDAADPASTTEPTTSASPSGPASNSAAPSDSPSAAPEPTPGDGDPFPELAPVAPQEPGEAQGVQAELVKFESVTGEVVGPGDVEAAAVRVTLDITNTGTTPLDLNLVVMNAYMGAQRDPAETYEKPGGAPVSGALAPGQTATGVYLFRIPEDRRNDVTFTVDYYAGKPAITFRGPVP